ncbi:uncharacterized protein LOC107500275 isoform X2 [Rousettus aegyptiacus]|uniref:uncharacterized protein LOC107500275 isoform X2 n=1 Tax=Rousettus aegyptiacus TaxID=9407 RepID=UPI00168D4842|nr:uncharacterized protein LOC107500275 isoform X2 [Rousettus aegyptiacus]
MARPPWSCGSQEEQCGLRGLGFIGHRVTPGVKTGQCRRGGCWEVPQSREHGPGLSHNARESRPLFRILDVTHSQAGATAHGKDLAENPRAVQPAPLWGAWGLRGQDPRLMPLSQTLIHAPAPASPLTRGGFGGQTGHSFRAAVHLTVDTAGARICRVDSPFLKAQRGGRPGGLTVHLRARPGGSRRPPASVQEAPATSTGDEPGAQAHAVWEVEFRFSRKVRTSKIRNLSGKLERRGKNLLLSRKDKGRTLERPPRKMEIKSPLKVQNFTLHSFITYVHDVVGTSALSVCRALPAPGAALSP